MWMQRASLQEAAVVSPDGMRLGDWARGSSRQRDSLCQAGKLCNPDEVALTRQPRIQKMGFHCSGHKVVRRRGLCVFVFVSVCCE